jgi:uncharacterized protein YbjT (DUF2867 family)
MTTPEHVIFGTGAVGLATYEALRRRGESVRLVNRSGHAPVSDDVEVVGGDARDPGFTSTAARGARVVYQTLNPPYSEWTAQFPALQAGVLAAAHETGARLVSMENVKPDTAWGEPGLSVTRGPAPTVNVSKISAGTALT